MEKKPPKSKVGRIGKSGKVLSPKTNPTGPDPTLVWTPEQRKKQAIYLAMGMKPGIAAAQARAFGPLVQYRERPDALLDRLRAGEKVVDLAAEHGISPIAMYEWLLRNVPLEWKSIQAARGLHRVERAEEGLDAAETMVEVAKNTQSGKMSQWNLERLLPSMYAPPGKDGGGGVTVNVVLDPSCGGRVQVVMPGPEVPAIDGESTSVTGG